MSELHQVFTKWRPLANIRRELAERKASLSTVATIPVVGSDRSLKGSNSAREIYDRVLQIDQRMRYLQKLFEDYDQASTDTFSQACHESCDILFTDAKMNTRDFIEQLGRCKASFPDMKFNATNLRLWKRGDECDDDIFAVDCFVTGTHTGRPFAFGPYPEISADGVAVSLDAERILFRLSSRKSTDKNREKDQNDDPMWEIVWTKVVPLGKRSGPSAMYEQIGGVVF